MSLYTAVARPVKLHQHSCVIRTAPAHICKPVNVSPMLWLLTCSKIFVLHQTHAAILLDIFGIVSGNFCMVLEQESMD